MSSVRDATPADLPGILAIYNEAVANTTSIWNWHQADLASRRAWFDDRIAAGYPVLVAAEGDSVLGYAAFGDWRPHDGYRHTVEHSVYVAADARGKGVGASLMAPLIEIARRLDKHVMLGGVTSDNAASIALHKRFGFIETARMPEVGRKFERWLDLLFLQKML